MAERLCGTAVTTSNSIGELKRNLSKFDTDRMKFDPMLPLKKK